MVLEEILLKGYMMNGRSSVKDFVFFILIELSINISNN
jgi:hypothetical protein